MCGAKSGAEVLQPYLLLCTSGAASAARAPAVAPKGLASELQEVVLVHSAPLPLIYVFFILLLCLPFHSEIAIVGIFSVCILSLLYKSQCFGGLQDRRDLEGSKKIWDHCQKIVSIQV